MTYDVAAVRAQFPALAEKAAHFDGSGGSQVPEPVARAVYETLRSAVANRGTFTAAERRAEHLVHEARSAMADLLDADARGIVFGRSMTQLTYDMSRALAKTWTAGDEVVVTRLDHDANIRPWVQAAATAGATVRWADFDPATGELTPEDIAAVLSPRTRLVAVTAASNLIGTRPDLTEISRRVHDTGALLYVDGVHHAAHTVVDVAALAADFYACSPYKLLGPHCGVVAAAPELLETLHPDKLLPSTDAVPERFELGTLPYELLAGCTAAVDFIATLSEHEHPSRRSALVSAMTAVERHEHALLRHLEAGLAELPAVTVYSRAAHRTPTVLFTVRNSTPTDVRRHLAERNINAPAGSFYAIEPARRLGLGADGGVRVGLAPYTDRDDVDRLLAGLEELTPA
ncbi:cysteine desulfurase-like protein [Planosporangium mesophilum]|uniref:Cysteine desulfurase-like protein n=1 Tax=Planosporangium mesophilum TaxID=689768 RepID=A0A8J3TEP9_9ACTN|nr:cysteine desulfurase-like protein [Planosporangium mesophilum]NJC86695.1 cysteine desulfurase-like protein [Planosporangium mesophilum]GII24121.1 cysteine desulfurase-like protein [Planosporangium mesophilum]